jgi:heme-degrading monooxygenase HmoA
MEQEKRTRWEDGPAVRAWREYEQQQKQQQQSERAETLLSARKARTVGSARLFHRSTS